MTRAQERNNSLLRDILNELMTIRRILNKYGKENNEKEYYEDDYRV